MNIYKLIKEKGDNKNIILKNTTTDTSLLLGKPTLTIIEILAKEIDGSKGITITDEWDLDISNLLAKELMVTAAPIKNKKPVKATTSTIQKPKIKSDKDIIDVFDLIFNTSN